MSDQKSRRPVRTPGDCSKAERSREEPSPGQRPKVGHSDDAFVDVDFEPSLSGTARPDVSSTIVPRRSRSSEASSERSGADALDRPTELESASDERDGREERDGLGIAEDARARELEASSEDPVTVGDLVEGARGMLSWVGTNARRAVDRGRYRKVRISRKGKPMLPDIPLAAVAALEAASVYGAGWARVLAANVGAKFLFDVEVVNDADRYFLVGQEALLEGNLERAEQALLKAVRIDDTHAGAYLQLGVLYRLKNDLLKARPVLERARVLDDAGEVGKKAENILEALDLLESSEGR